MRNSRQSLHRRVFLYTCGVLLAVFIIAPFYWLLVSSISTKAELLAAPVHWFPRNPTLENYGKLLSGGGTMSTSGGEVPPFNLALRNSLVICASVNVACLVIGALAAYAFARMDFWIKKQLLVAVIAIRMLPEISLVVPLYVIMSRLRMLDTLGVLIVVYSSFILPFVIWMLRSYFQSIPRELEEAAAVDGSSRIGTLLRIILPLAVPGIVTTAIFTLLTAWDEFLFGLIMTSTYASKTIPVSISEFTTRHLIDYGLMTTGGVLASLPPVVLSLALQKYIIKGLTEGSVKG
jgi:multiple sugar transport system permease protein